MRGTYPLRVASVQSPRCFVRFEDRLTRWAALEQARCPRDQAHDLRRASERYGSAQDVFRLPAHRVRPRRSSPSTCGPGRRRSAMRRQRGADSRARRTGRDRAQRERRGRIPRAPPRRGTSDAHRGAGSGGPAAGRHRGGTPPSAPGMRRSIGSRGRTRTRGHQRIARLMTNLRKCPRELSGGNREI